MERNNFYAKQINGYLLRLQYPKTNPPCNQPFICFLTAIFKSNSGLQKTVFPRGLATKRRKCWPRKWNNGAEMYDSNGNFIRRSDRVVPGETSKFTQAGAGGSTVQKMVNAINSLSDEQRALLPPPDIILQLLLAEANAGGDWEGMLERATGVEKDPPTDFKKLFSSKLKMVGRFIEKISEWGSNVGTASNMFIDSVKGTGADKIYYIEDRVADSMPNAYRFEGAREFLL